VNYFIISLPKQNGARQLPAVLIMRRLTNSVLELLLLLLLTSLTSLPAGVPAVLGEILGNKHSVLNFF
jgi:hypothetical protein